MKNRQPRPWPAVETTRSIPPEDRPTPPARAEANQTRKGRRQSPETRAKISEAQKGKKLSPETKAKISKANKGRKRSPETKAKIGEANKGKKHYLYDQNIDKVHLAIVAHVRGELISQASRNQGFNVEWLGSWKRRHPERFQAIYMEEAAALDQLTIQRAIGAYILGLSPEEASFDRDQSGIGLARRALRLCYDEDLSTAEASQELGLEPGWLDQYQQTHPSTYQELNSIIRHSRG